MKFIVDAQLPIRLKHWMIERGHDVIHTMDLPNQQFTSDQEIINKAEKENRIVISKDSDFFKQNLIKGTPKRILFITTGNIVNKELIRLLELNIEIIESLFESDNKIIEINNHSITVH